MKTKFGIVRWTFYASKQAAQRAARNERRYGPERGGSKVRFRIVRTHALVLGERVELWAVALLCPIVRSGGAP